MKVQNISTTNMDVWNKLLFLPIMDLLITMGMFLTPKIIQIVTFRRKVALRKIRKNTKLK